MTEHFSDTRTQEGRVRFLLEQGGVRLIAEGPGWARQAHCPDLISAALTLAFMPQLPQGLYEEAILDVQRRVSFSQLDAA